MPTDPSAAGPTVGSRTAFTFFGNVLPGHEQTLRNRLNAAQQNPTAAIAVLREIGTLHEARWVLFDDDRRVMFCSSFDGSWDQYIADFAVTKIGEGIDENLKHVEGWVGIKDPGASDWLLAHAVPAPSYIAAYPEPTVKEIWKALAVQDAFQQVLDSADADQALSQPALKPLLEQAST